MATTDEAFPTAPALHWIDGRAWNESHDGLIDVGSEPVLGRPLRSVAVAGAATVESAVRSASNAQKQWHSWTPTARGRALRRLGELMIENAAELRELERYEVGKTFREMNGYVENGAEYFELYGGLTRTHFGSVIDVGRADHAYTTYDPFGVVAAITPWNIPLSQACRAVAPALAAGNAVVIKPAEFTPSTTIRIAELAIEAGLPAGLLNVVVGDGSSGAELSRHPLVRLIAFTGSVQTGRHVAVAAAERLVPTILELGGKSPNIIFEDADIDAAIPSITGICSAAGQRCGALTRTLVHESIYEQVIERAAHGLSGIEPGVDIPPLTTPAQYAKVIEYFDVARAEGARVVVGGSAVEGGVGRFVEPTLLADVGSDMRVFQEEIFGPVVTVTPFRTEAEAVRLANATDYGLVAHVWTNDIGRALRVSRAIDSGQVLVNGGRNGIDIPFGGYKNSGIGREKGMEALRQYSQLKSTVIAVGEI